MNKFLSRNSWFGGGFKLVRKIIKNIFSYLSCHESETLNDRHLLRELYSAGYIDELKYQDCCEQCSKGEFDPEDLHLPM